MAQFFRIIDYILFNIPFFALHYLNCSCLEVSFRMNLRKKLLSKLKKSQFGNQSNRSFCILILSTARKTKLPLYYCLRTEKLNYPYILVKLLLLKLLTKGNIVQKIT